jgi:hypothetical protein
VGRAQADDAPAHFTPDGKHIIFTAQPEVEYGD